MFEKYDREELYRKVWEKPMLKVAEEYGVSSVALGKTCRRLSVPLPGRGYWAKVAYGHEGEKKTSAAEARHSAIDPSLSLGAEETNELQ